MVEPTDVNVKGKVIVPLPELALALVRHSLKVNEQDFKKSLYAPAFGELIKDMTDALAKDPNGFDWIDKTRAGRYIFGYAWLKSFDSYELVPIVDDVNFTLGEGSNWSRPFHFDLYHDPEIDGTTVNLFRSVDDKIMTFVPVVRKDIDGFKNLDASFELNKQVADNRRSTNAFIRKFGVSIDNSNLQSILDSSLSLIEKYTH